MYQEKFATALRKKMTEQHISQAQVSRLTGIDNSIISRVMTGRRKHISYETISTIANKLSMWLGKTPDELARTVLYLEKKNKKQTRIIYFLVILELITILLKGLN